MKPTKQIEAALEALDRLYRGQRREAMAEEMRTLDDIETIRKFISAVPEGYALVPIEPTWDMAEAGYCAGDGDKHARAIYKAMIQAALKESDDEN